MDVSKTSIRLPNGNFLDAQDASEQYWGQRPANGYFESNKEPRFNATASGRSAEVASIHQPQSNFDDGSGFEGLKDSDPANPDA